MKLEKGGVYVTLESNENLRKRIGIVVSDFYSLPTDLPPDVVYLLARVEFKLN